MPGPKLHIFLFFLLQHTRLTSLLTKSSSCCKMYRVEVLLNTALGDLSHHLVSSLCTLLFDVAEDSAAVIALDLSKRLLQLTDEMQQCGRVCLQNTGTPRVSIFQMQLQGDCRFHLLSQSPAGQL